MSLIISALDRATLGSDLDLGELEEFGQLIVHDLTSPEQVVERCRDVDVVLSNKVVLSKEVIEGSSRLKLICTAGTGVQSHRC